MRMVILTATIGHAKTEECIASWGTCNTIGSELPPLLMISGRQGMMEAYQRAYKDSVDFDVLGYIHDDVLIGEENWHERVLKEFEDENVGVVGFGGAVVHGSANIYKVPYNLQQLGRSGYLSNVDDAEVHGQRFNGACDVAVLDGFALFIRRELLDKTEGWPLGTPLGYSLYDYWLCCMAHRHGYRIRLAGVRCHHLGGMTSVGMKVIETDGMAHVVAHRYVYDTFRDVLPWTAGQK